MRPNTTGLAARSLIRIYRTMFLSRQMDDREIQLKRQNKMFFQISGAGHEAVLVAAGLVLKSGYDWFFPYYRDRALALMVGVTPDEMLLAGRGREGRSCLRRPPDAFALGNPQVEHGDGLFPDRHAMAARRGRGGSFALLSTISEGARAGAQGAAGGDSLHVSSPTMSLTFRAGKARPARANFSRRSTPPACGSFPVLFLVEDNGYAISVPVEYQTAGGSISKLVTQFPAFARRGMRRHRSAGKLRRRCSRAVAHCRARKGPGAGSCARDASLFAFAFR